MKVKKALVVDDNQNNLLLEKDLLELAGFEVFSAENALDGIQIAREEKLDVIIMDVRLPDMLGTEAARVLRNDIIPCGVPIIFVTASLMADGMDEVKTIANSGVIGKPINTRTFARDIIELIKKIPGENHERESDNISC